MHALLFSVPIAAMFASTIRMSRASMISRSGMSVGWLKNRLQRRDAHQPGDLVARRVHPLGHAPRAHPQIVGQLGAEELGGLVEVGLRRARLGDHAPGSRRAPAAAACRRPRASRGAPPGPRSRVAPITAWYR